MRGNARLLLYRSKEPSVTFLIGRFGRSGISRRHECSHAVDKYLMSAPKFTPYAVFGAKRNMLIGPAGYPCIDSSLTYILHDACNSHVDCCIRIGHSMFPESGVRWCGQLERARSS